MRVIKDRVRDKLFVVVSQSEPYIHFYEEDEIRCRRGRGGIVTALDPILQACGGLWISYGEGSADKDVTDDNDCVMVPVDEPKYTLKRVWLSREEVDGYLNSSHHSMLYPLCHFVYIRPRFNKNDWGMYKKVNKKFAKAVIDSIGDRSAFVWVHDAQLALCSRYINEMRSDIVTAMFWHIPLPNPEIFKICPWHKEIVESLLYNDLIGFQIRHYCNNFLNLVDQTLEARIDRETSTVFFRGSQTSIREFPISIDSAGVKKASERISEDDATRIKKHFGLRNEIIALGVERRDYNKGLPEKFIAVERFLENNPEYIGKFVLIQIAQPTRTQVKEYQEINKEITILADNINWRLGVRRWTPIILVDKFIPTTDVITLFKIADMCLITSLHDGMNLVAKEYVSANIDKRGVLILSKFTGAARELKNAIIINPYSIGDISSAIKRAIEMTSEEREDRMTKMQEEINENNIYMWASDNIERISKLESTVVNKKHYYDEIPI